MGYFVLINFNPKKFFITYDLDKCKKKSFQNPLLKPN